MVRRELNCKENLQGKAVFVLGLVALASILGKVDSDTSDSEDDGAVAGIALSAHTTLVALACPRLNNIDWGTYPRRALSDFSDAECESRMRFRHVDDIRRLIVTFAQHGLPNIVRTASRYVFAREEAIGILLSRFAVTDRLDDLCKIWGRRPSHVSEVLHYLYDWFYTTYYGPVLNNLRRWVQHLPRWANLVHDMGGPLPGCWGFIDGTLCRVLRPVKLFKRFLYTGHKRFHALKFLAFTAPNGLCVWMWGPCAARRHDAHAMTLSNVMHDLIWMHGHHPGRRLYGYGDGAFPLSPHLMNGYKGATLPWQHLFNTDQNRLRTSVEWNFGRVGNLWPVIEYKQKKQIFKMPVASMFFIGQLLTNCHTCLYGNIISSFFGDMSVPSLEQYLDISGADVPLPPP